MSINTLEQQVLIWASNKGILQANDPEAQLRKFNEEAEEFTEACDDEDFESVKSEGGDVLVTLIINLHLRGSSVEEALQTAYDKISKRKGKMENGAFVKEGS